MKRRGPFELRRFARNLGLGLYQILGIETARTEEFWTSPKGFYALAGLVVVIWLANFGLMPYFFGGEERSTAAAGSAGDMFGGITALFSGLAFAGLVTTLFMQRKELQLQRNELSQTREVFRIQRFEATFFGLLKLFGDHVNSLEGSKSDLGCYLGPNSGAFTQERGRGVLKMYAEHLPDAVKKIKTGESYNPAYEDGDTKTKEELCDEYDDYYLERIEPDMGPYFRLCYNIIRHIEHTVFSDDGFENDKQKLVYSKIFRAHLSSSEVKLLMFNCVSVHGLGLKGWVEKHSLLRHITRTDYETFRVLAEDYDSKAFRFDER